MPEPWDSQREALGSFIRTQRKLANLSLRQLAEMTSLSNPYLSQVERGLHQPSVRVLKLISDALNVSAETLLAQAGLLDADRRGASPSGQARAGQPAAPRRTPKRLSSLISASRMSRRTRWSLSTGVCCARNRYFGGVRQE